MDVGGDAAFLELLELPPHVEVRLKSSAASRDRIAEDKPVEHPHPPPRAALDRRYEPPGQCSDTEIADKRLTKICGNDAAVSNDGWFTSPAKRFTRQPRELFISYRFTDREKFGLRFEVAAAGRADDRPLRAPR